MRDAGSLLVRAGLIEADALAEARASRSRSGGTLAEHLVLAGVVADDELTTFFRERLMVPRVSGERLRSIPRRIIARIPSELAAELRVVPVALDSESSLTIAMSDPSDTHALDELEFFTEHYVVRAVASQRQIAWCLDHYYGLTTPLLGEGPSSADFDEFHTEPFSVAGEPRSRSLSAAVGAARRPASAPAASELDATLEDLETAASLEVDDSELESEDGSGSVGAQLALELDADEPVTAEHLLADGSPGELAPRVGEVLVNLPRDRGARTTPAVVLDDSVFVPPSTAQAKNERHEPVDLEDEATGELVRLEAEEPQARDEPEPSDGRVRAAVAERGTDSAPILLSALAAKDAAESEESEVEIESVDADKVDPTAVVLLESPKRKRRPTSIGVGAPAKRTAAVLGLRTAANGEAQATNSSASANSVKTAPPVVVDDQEKTNPLRELDSLEVETIKARDLESAGKSAAKRAASKAAGTPLRGLEAAAVSELESSWGDDEEEKDAGRDRLLDTLESLARAEHRDEIVAAVLDYLDHYCERVVFLALKGGALEPFQIRSTEPTEPKASARLPLRGVSLLRDIVDTRLPYRGPIDDAASQELLRSVFGSLGDEGLALPVAVRGRVVGLLYGDGIAASLSGDNVGLVTQSAGRALERSLRR